MAIGELKPLDWNDVMTKPESADNSGGAVLVPDSVPNSTDHAWLWVTDRVRFVLFRLRYNRAISGAITSPVVQIFGKTGAGLNFPLLNVLGVHEFTLTIDLTTDVDDGTTYKWTKPIKVFVHGHQGRAARALATIKTPFFATGTLTDSSIEAMVII